MPQSITADSTRGGFELSNDSKRGKVSRLFPTHETSWNLYLIQATLGRPSLDHQMANRESDLLNKIEALRARNAQLERELAQYKELHPEAVETHCEGCGEALAVAFLDFNEDFGHLCDNCYEEWEESGHFVDLDHVSRASRSARADAQAERRTNKRPRLPGDWLDPEMTKCDEGYTNDLHGVRAFEAAKKRKGAQMTTE